VNLVFWVPSPSQFQGRYLSTGGGGLSINSGTSGLAGGIGYGAVAAYTDGGFHSTVTNTLLVANGTMNYEALYMFAYKGIHEMSELGKEFTRLYFNVSDIYSYYQGCSEGGREGFSQVQRYGSQFDGAVIGAPAFRQAYQQVFHLFEPTVEKYHSYAPPPCELDRINNDTITACDALDGRVDGVVSRTDLCKLHYNATKSIGKAYSCAASRGGFGSGPAPAYNGTVSSTAAAIANDIWKGLYDDEGRQLYVSFQPSATFADAATSYNTITGGWDITASGLSAQYIQYFLNEVASSSLSMDGITYDILRAWILQGLQKFSSTLQTVWPDLEDFQGAGGKVIHFHGESDNSVPAASSVLYHEAVRTTMYGDLSFNESQQKLGEWYRLFLVPGGAHCQPAPQQSNSAWPQTNLATIIDWVEKGIVPTQLNSTVLQGGNKGQTQKVCAWPLRPLWTKNGTSMKCEFDQASFDSWTPKLTSIPLPVS
jgi:tannase